MTLAAMQTVGVRSLASLVFLGWSVAATAQPAPAAAPTASTAPPATAPPPPASAPAPAATPPKAATPAGPAAKPTAATKNAATAPHPGASNTPAATATGTPTGESWGAAPSPSAPAGNQNSPGSGPSRPGATSAGDGNAAPPVYYVEQGPAVPNNAGPPPPSEAASAAAASDVEPMNLQIEEPPPPPVPRHVAPRTALWLGARVGYFIPFGDLWGRCTSSGYGPCDGIQGAKFSDVATSGPMFELDAGVRVARNYVIYLGWERAQLGGADGASPVQEAGNQLRAESDFVAVGVRLSADPDDIGLLLDLAIGARRFRGFYEGDSQLQLSNAPIESRLGIGVDIRTTRSFSLSPMLTLGLGSFGKAEWVSPGQVQDAIPAGSDRLTHGWLTLQLGGHFDVGGGG